MRKSGSGLLLEIILSVTISALIITMSGCGSADEKEKGSRAAVNEENSTTTKEDTELYESKAETETSETVEDTDVTETECDTEAEAGESSATVPYQNETEADTQTSAEPVTEKPYVPETEATTPDPTEAPTPAPTQPPTEAPTEPLTEADTRPTYDYMSESYLAEAEAYLVQYINEYRVAEGNVALQLSNCSKAYAKGRSRQIVTNFAHDTDDQRALATELKYGDYVEPSLYGMSGEPYYEGWGHEALAQLNVNEYMPPEQVGRNFANAFHKSKGHWNYVGSVVEHYKRYTHVAVGITACESGEIYACVYVLPQSYD